MAGFKFERKTSLRSLYKQLGDDISRATTAAMSEVTDDLKNELRQQVEAAGLGTRLANTWRGTTYPGDGRSSLSPATYVFSKAPDIIDAFDRAPIVIPLGGRKYLAIPTPTAGVLHTSTKAHARLTPALWEAETGVKLRFFKPPGKRYALLVTDAIYRRQAHKYQLRKSFHPIKEGPGPDQAKTIVIFILVPQARMPKRLNVDEAAAHWADQVPSILERRLGDA